MIRARLLPVALTFAVICALVSRAAPAQDADTDTRPILAVYEIQVEGVSLTEKKISALTEYFRGRITAEKAYRVVPGEATARALVEIKAASHDPHCDTNCKIELGKALAAQKWVETRVDKVGGKCSVSGTVYDVGQEISEGYGETDNPVACTETGLRAGLKEVARKLDNSGVMPAQAPATDAAGGILVRAPRTVVTETGSVVDTSEIDTGEDIVNMETGLTGIVVIDSTPPGASLMVNGRHEGVAKKTIQLNVGRYVIVASLDDYYHVARGEVVVEANKVQRVMMDLKPAFGALNVDCSPTGAEVFIDGRFAGACPLRNPKLKSGAYLVEVRKGYYESLSRQVTIRDGATTTEHFELPAAWGKLEIDSTPRGAEVWFDGRQIGVTPMTTDMTAAGVYNVRLIKAFFEPVSLNVTLGDGLTVRKDVALSADYGSVTVDTTPRGATVVVDDGVDRCESTTCTFPQLATGLHVLTIEKEGYGREVRNVDLARGARQTVRVELRAKTGSLTIFAKYDDGGDCEGEIFIDGQRQPELTPFMGQLIATPHTIEVRCPGSVPVTETVTVEHNRTVTRTLQACRPYCDGRSCGPDGCGGDCGTCYGGRRCDSGKCVAPPAPSVRPYSRPTPSTFSTPRLATPSDQTASRRTASNAGAPKTQKPENKGPQLTWETLGVGYVGSTSGLWHAVTITPIEIGLKAFKGLLFSAFIDWQILIPWNGAGDGFLNAIHLGVRLGYEVFNFSDNLFAIFVDGKLGWEYNFVLGGALSSSDVGLGTFASNAMIVGASVGFRVSYVKLRVCIDYSTSNGLGAGLMFSIGN